MGFPHLDRFVEGLPPEGSYSLWAGPTQGPRWVTHRDREPHYAASTMKLALVIAGDREAGAERLSLDDTVSVHTASRRPRARAGSSSTSPRTATPSRGRASEIRS